VSWGKGRAARRASSPTQLPRELTGASLLLPLSLSLPSPLSLPRRTGAGRRKKMEWNRKICKWRRRIFMGGGN